MGSIEQIVWNVLRRVKSLRKDYNTLSPGKRDDIVNDLRFLNIKRLVVFTVIVVMVQALNIIKLLIMNPLVSKQELIIHSTLLLILVFYLSIINYCVKNNKHKIYQWIYLSFWCFFIAIFFFLSHDNITNNDSLIISMILFVSLCIIPILPLDEYKYIIGLQVIFILSLFFERKHEFVIILNAIFINAAAFGFTRVNYYTFLNLQIKEKRLVEINSNLEELALRDSLTGLLNRRGLEVKLDVLWPLCIRESQSAAIIMLDIDYFKQFNDKYGHVEGDRCLSEVASAIKHAAKRRSDVIARVGGEEFLVFAHNVDATQALLLANEIKEKIKTIDLNKSCSTENKVTVSIGVAVVVPNRSNTFIDLYMNADKCLYQAKETGRNCIVMNNNSE